MSLECNFEIPNLIYAHKKIHLLVLLAVPQFVNVKYMSVFCKHAYEVMYFEISINIWMSDKYIEISVQLAMF